MFFTSRGIDFIFIHSFVCFTAKTQLLYLPRIINMNRGGVWRQKGGSGSRGRPANPSHDNCSVGEGRTPTADAVVSKDGLSPKRGRIRHPRSWGQMSRGFRYGTSSGNEHGPNNSSEDPTDCSEEEDGLDMSGGGSKLPDVAAGLNLVSESHNNMFPTLSESTPIRYGCKPCRPRQVGEVGVSDSVMQLKVDDKELQKATSEPLKYYEANDQNSCDMAQNRDSGRHDLSPIIEPFDICSPTKVGVTLKPSLFVKNRGNRNELKNAIGSPNVEVLRPGMVILKKYLSMADQVKIVEICRSLGLGPGGFYQPAYSNGARLRLKMMCLGRNWDPETSRYGLSRLHDGALAPILPPEFHQLVKKAIEDSNAHIQRERKASSGEDILPRMKPDICIVNFYYSSGKLGLHQDKDESPESLRKGLPVVSFSIGDSGEFLYSDERDVDKAEKVLLESGDVLIFGGKSRHIFHGVSSILSKTAPKDLRDKTNLRPGRLNLTFREY